MQSKKETEAATENEILKDFTYFEERLQTKMFLAKKLKKSL